MYQNNNSISLVWLLAFAFVALTVFIAVPPILRKIDLNVTCTGYLDRAANANTVELAAQQLDKAIAEIERRGWTEGSSKVFFDHPQCDIGYWYSNLIAARKELRELPASSSSLEKSNLLMKLRESLTDTEEGSQHLIIPPNINYYPNQVMWVLWWWFGGFLLLMIGILTLVS